MNNLIQLATAELAGFLDSKLPSLSKDWWTLHVVDRLTFQQQRMIQERHLTTLRQLDLAALLRVLDQNWYELSGEGGLPRQGRHWVKEMQTVRNKWAHLSAETMPPSETYRDADTLGRLLEALGSGAVVLRTVEEIKANALVAMAPPPEPVRQSPMPTGPVFLFQPGTLVTLRSSPSEVMPVLEVVPGGAETRYRVFQGGKQVVFYESQLQALPQAEAAIPVPLDPAALQARLTSLHVMSPSSANLFSLRSGRVQFVPYQYRPVLKLIRADRPRLLIADEVGVGKTIETGLIIKELRARMNLQSILVICPKALISERKWFNEMKRFDEHFTALDGPLLRHCLKESQLEGEWPDQYKTALLPFSLFDSDMLFGRGEKKRSKVPGLLELDPPPRFDLVIVDEAHHLRNPENYLHKGVRALCDNAQAVVLLTATPVQLGNEDLFTLLNVLRPDLIIDRASFNLMAAPNRFINEAIRHCRAAKPGWQSDAAACLQEVAATGWGRQFIRESEAFQRAHDMLQEESVEIAARVALIRTLEELYTFSPLINRTRRRDIGDFTTRRPQTITSDFTASQRSLHDGLLELVADILSHRHGQENVKFMMTTLRRQAASCLYGLAPMLEDLLAGKLNQLETMEASDSDDEVRLDFVDEVRSEIGELLRQARTLDASDPKRDAFLKVLADKQQCANNKALVFSTFRHTLAYLVEHVRHAGLRVGLVHGSIPDEERAVIRRRFALPREDAEALDVLLSSEVGCEGLDFQFCDLLINYDLPWNPMRIEQRIGRIDRYGQKSETVAVVNLITPGTVDAEIYDRCLWRIGVFHHAIGGCEEILGDVTRELHHIADSYQLGEAELESRLQQLADNNIRLLQEQEKLESQQAELFGLNLPEHSWQEDLQEAESTWLSPDSVQRMVEAYLGDRLPGGSEPLVGQRLLKSLRLGHEARSLLLEDFRRLPPSRQPVARQWEQWLTGNQPTLSVSFDQAAAAENAGVIHLSLFHPLVRQAAAHLEVSEPQWFRFSVPGDEGIVGTHAFAIYRWSWKGIKSDETLVAVAADEAVRTRLLSLLQGAAVLTDAPLPDQAACDRLDELHHLRWSAARADHMARNRQLAEHRMQSLTASHRARMSAIDDQISRSSDARIRLMKESERGRAQADFDRHMADLQRLADSGDIQATPVVFGTLTSQPTE